MTGRSFLFPDLRVRDIATEVISVSLNIGIFGCGRGRTCAKTVYGAGLDIRVSALCDADLGKLNEF